MPQITADRSPRPGWAGHRAGQRPGDERGRRHWPLVLRSASGSSWPSVGGRAGVVAPDVPAVATPVTTRGDLEDSWPPPTGSCAGSSPTLSQTTPMHPRPRYRHRLSPTGRGPGGPPRHSPIQVSGRPRPDRVDREDRRRSARAQRTAPHRKRRKWSRALRMGNARPLHLRRPRCLTPDRHTSWSESSTAPSTCISRCICG